MNKSVQAHIALIIANIIYGINFTLAKDVLPAYIKPFGFILIRVLTAVVCFTLLDFIFGRAYKIEKSDYKRLALCGFFGVAFNQLFFFKGLSITTPINSAILMMGTPIIVVVFSALWLKERLSKRIVLGLFMGVAGSLIILLLNKQLRFGTETFLGDFYIFINAVSYGFYMVLVAPLMKKYHPITVLKWVFSIGLIFVLPVSYPEALEVDWSTFSTEIWLKTAYVVIGTTVIAYFLNIFAMKTLSPTIVSVYLYTQPLVAAIYAFMLGKDEITAVKIIGGICIFLGVYWVSIKKQDI